ncbi:PPOX class F420-dependent oxidoreductase [Nocardia sp. AG03]|uniref:PPOX class F420-dependent oxidoreductase n=1 Tax=Nocardia sp. AG03 TaxID=3025312 RepID=UPI0024187B7A|nr:PPOX class F420-dependent oxidoreductase [Nocardia sp. AG03]
MTNRLGEAATANYVLLTTFRKDGTPVATPVWAVEHADKLYVWTVTDSWKVKRIRRNGEVTVQACNARGGAPHGAVVSGTARLLDGGETDQVRSWLRRKYWLTGPLVLLASNLRRGKDGTIGIEITPA